MAIITQQENFLLKFKQENSQAGSKPVEVSVTKSDDQYVIELRHDKKSYFKIDIESLKEIINYIDSKIYFSNKEKNINKNTISDSTNLSVGGYLKISGNSNVSFNDNPGLNGPSGMESKGFENAEEVAGYADLLRDIGTNDIDSNKSGIYNSQADVILSNAIDINSLSE